MARLTPWGTAALTAASSGDTGGAAKTAAACRARATMILLSCMLTRVLLNLDYENKEFSKDEIMAIFV